MKHIYWAVLMPLFITGCVGASTFGMREEVYQQTLVSIKNKSVSLKINKMEFTGSSREIGRQKAKILLQRPTLNEVLQNTLSFSRVILGEPEKVKATIRQYFPDLYEELLSFAEHSGFSEDEVFSFVGSHFAIGGCTVFVRSGNQPVLARNYDWTPTLVDGILASHKGMSGRFSSLTITASIFGALSGINRKGLVVAIAGINSNKNYYNAGGLSMPIIVRGVLETAINVESAIAILKRVPHTTSASYALADRSGNIAVVEVSPPKLDVRRDFTSQGFLTAANHFQKLDNDVEGVRVMPNSVRRIKAVNDFHAQYPRAGYKDLLSFMGQVNNGPAMENYSMMLGTLWSIIYLPKSGEMAIRVGLNGEPVIVGFSNTLPLTIVGTINDKPPKLSDYF